jgi:glycine/D-amino acid oxidase-like deaminating enzyme
MDPQLGRAGLLEHVSHEPLWLDVADRPPAREPLRGARIADLVVVGGGLTGLWSAMRALERDAARDVVLIESGRIAEAASGRNGGFVDASLTHGLENGLAHFPRESAVLERLGRENLEAIASTVAHEEIACGFERTGSLEVATAPWQAVGLAERASLGMEFGQSIEVLERSVLRRRVDSPTYLAGLAHLDRTALVDPARLAFGLALAAEARGAAIHEHSEVVGIEREGSGVRVSTPEGSVRAVHVIVATSAFPPLVRRIRRYVLPVYDYVLATEPLSSAQLASLGWSGREGISDLGNQFHYYRLTPDDRLLFGGFDAIYHFGNGLGGGRDVRPASFALLADHLISTFPQLEGVAISHAWGGAIDTCSRFCAFFGRALDSRVVYAAGFTGLGVGASRFAADVMIDLLGGATERSELEMVRKAPVPFPPEPLRSLVVAQTRRSLRHADERDGHRDGWLRLLDRIGVGFDS